MWDIRESWGKDRYGGDVCVSDAVILQTYPIGRIGDPLQFCLLCLGVQQNH